MIERIHQWTLPDMNLYVWRFSSYIQIIFIFFSNLMQNKEKNKEKNHFRCQLEKKCALLGIFYFKLFNFTTTMFFIYACQSSHPPTNVTAQSGVDFRTYSSTLLLIIQPTQPASTRLKEVLPQTLVRCPRHILPDLIISHCTYQNA